jgi:polysaccharide biosynthesis/export protein
MLKLFSKRCVTSITLLSLLVGCSSYKQGIMFTPQKGFKGDAIQKEQLSAEKNYVIQVNDQLKLQVFSNKGERIIDPNGELLKQQSVAAEQNRKANELIYWIDNNGMMKAPMVGLIRLQGLTIREAELLLQKEYDQYYKECYVALTYQNKRVVVLGATGGQVIPLTNENMRLTEILALAKGITNTAKARNIRLIRNEATYILDFSTLGGLQKGNMIVEPGDIVYVEPVVRPFVEGFRDASPMISLVLSISTLALVIINTTNSQP